MTRAERWRAFRDAFDPDQPRDPAGKWTSGGASAIHHATEGVKKPGATPGVRNPRRVGGPPGSSKSFRNEPAIHEIAGGLGFKHAPGEGYKPELNPFQRYKTDKPVPTDKVVNRLRSAGFQPAMGFGGNVDQSKMHKTYAGTYSASLERTAAPYHTESVELRGNKTGSHVVSMTHHRAHNPGD